MTGVPQAIASIITRPNGSGQSIGTSSAMAPLRNSGFSTSLISPINSTLRPSIIGSIVVVEIGFVDPIDLGGDLQRNAGLAGDTDGAVRPLFRADPAEERQVARSTGRGSADRLATHDARLR